MRLENHALPDWRSEGSVGQANDMALISSSFFGGHGGSSGASNNDFVSKLHFNSILWHDPIDLVEVYSSFSNQDIPEDLLNFEHECRVEYKVDSMVVINTKSLVGKLREIFKIPNDFEIILPGKGVIHSNLPLCGIIIFIDQIFVGLGSRSTHWYNNSFVK